MTARGARCHRHVGEARSPSYARIYRRGTPIQAVPAGPLRHLTNAVPALSQAPRP